MAPFFMPFVMPHAFFPIFPAFSEPVKIKFFTTTCFLVNQVEIGEV
jgi:hypothetical protein